MFKFNDNANITIKNLDFKNFNSSSFKINGANCHILLINWTFLDYNKIDYIEIQNLDEYHYSYSCELTPEIIQLAKKIAGTSNDVEAAKKLAKWINTNIKHETAEGFYQSPTETLKSKKGNCCCHAELFVQMCHALNITQNHKIGFVHVGSMVFGKRHFFVIFDNICVDCDCNFNNPWGHAQFSNRSVYDITMYPLLPLVRTY